MNLEDATQQVVGEIETVMNAEYPGLMFVLSTLRGIASVTTVVDERFVEHFGFSDSSSAKEEPVVVGTEQMIGREGESLGKHLLADGKTATEKTETDEISREVAEDMSLDLVI